MVLRVRISHPTFRDEEEVWIVFQFQRHQKEDSTKMRWKPWKASTKKHQMLKKAQKLMVILVLGRDEAWKTVYLYPKEVKTIRGTAPNWLATDAKFLIKK